MASKAVAKQAEPQLPDLVPTAAEDFEIDSRDIQPPRLKVASPTTGAAADGLVPNFSLFSQKGKEDDEPTVLVKPGDTEGIKVYVLRMYKTKSANVNPMNWQEEMRRGGELRSWAFDDPSAPPFARTMYNYVVYVPDSDDADLPHNLQLGNTSTPTARTINTVIAQGMKDGKPAYTMPFALYPEKREREVDGQTNRWAIFKARQVEPEPEHVAAAIEMRSLISRAKPAHETEAPVVDATPAPAI